MGVKIQDTKRGRKFQKINVVAAQFKDASGKNIRIAPFCYKESMNSEIFETWFKTKLVKSAHKGSTFIMDRASFHREKKLKNLARRHGFRLQLLPAYSPDLNPIEKTWANMKRALIDALPNEEDLESAMYGYLMN
jgi:transposase